MIEVLNALARLLEPTSQVTVEVLDVPPLEWLPDHLYVYPTGTNEYTSIDTGPQVRHDFEVRCDLIVQSDDEADQRRDADLAAHLLAVQQRYMDTIRQHPTTALWAYIRPAVDTAPRTLQARGAAIRVIGYRIVN